MNAITEINKHFAEAADLARCNGMVATLLADASMAASVEAYEAAGLGDLEVTDKEIIEMGADLGLTPDAWIERLITFCGRMTAITSTGQRYSRTTFKDNGEPIFLNADGSRSIFCDVAD
jgi:hypothetical protein